MKQESATDTACAGSGEQCLQITVRQQDGVIVTLRCSDISIIDSEVSSSLSSGPAELVYHGTRRIHNGDMLFTSGLDAGCLEIHYGLSGGGGGCSRIRPDDHGSVLANTHDTANELELNRSTAEGGQEQTVVSHSSGEEKTAVAAAGTSGLEGGNLRTVFASLDG